MRKMQSQRYYGISGTSLGLHSMYGFHDISVPTEASFSAPLSLCWQVTSSCNYNCPFCYRILNSKPVSIATARRIVDDLAQAGIVKVTWTGGEPSLWKPLPRLIEYARHRGLTTSLITNGSLLTVDDAFRFREILDWITFPLEGPDEASNTIMGRKPGHYSHILRLAEAFANEGIHVKINTVLSSINVQHVSSLALLVNELPVKRWKVFQFYPVREYALMNAHTYHLGTDNFVLAAQLIRRLSLRSDLAVTFASNRDLEGGYLLITPDCRLLVSADNEDIEIGSLLNDSITRLYLHQAINRSREFERHKWLLKSDGSPRG